MATVTKSIGTSSRDYSTISAWEADLDNASIYSSGDIAKGECYDDGDFTESILLTFNGGTIVELDKMLLTVPVGQRHDGTAGSGAQVNFAAGARWLLSYGPASGGGDFPMERTVEWLELNGAGNSHTEQYALNLSTGGATTYYGQVNHLLVHDFNHTGGHNWEAIDISSSYSCVHNCIVYDCQSVYNCIGVHCHASSTVAVNNTVYKMKSTQTGVSDNKGVGIWFSETPTANKNNIAMGSEAVVTQADFYSNVGTYNLSSDATATGSNSVVNQATANIFISTTNGSEDLHILRSSSAVGAAEDLGTGVTMGSITAGSSTYGTPLNRDINNGDRNSRAMAWDIGASQNAIISTIGTTGREYSTVAAWLADLDDDTYYGAGSVARGECYADSTFTFTGVTTLSGGDTIDLVCKVLTAADDQRHDGTASGTHVKFSSNARFAMSGAWTILSWLDISWTGTSTAYEALRYIDVVNHCLIHDVTLNYTGATWRQVGVMCRQVHNNIIYDINRTADNNYPLYGIFCDGSYKMANQNTVYNVNSVGDGATTYGIYMNFSWDNAAQLSNNISMGTTNAGTGSTVLDIKAASGSSSRFATNMSSDSGSSVGADGLTSKTAANQFISTANDSQDFHLKSGSDAIGAGTDLGIGYHDGYGTGMHNYYGYDWYSTGWQYDIDNRNRIAEGDDWDIGADQFVAAAAATTNTAFMFFVD